MPKMKRVSIFFILLLIVSLVLHICPMPKAEAGTGVFGYEIAGTLGSEEIGNQIRGAVFTGASGEAFEMSAHLYGSWEDDATKVKLGIYKHSDSSFVAETIERTWAHSITKAWYNFSFSSNPTIEAIDYVLVAWSNRTGTMIYIDNGDANQEHINVSTYNSFPDPIQFTHSNDVYSIFCNYTTGETTKYFYGNVTQQYSVKHENTWSFNLYPHINPRFTVNSEKTVSFNLYARINPIFSIESRREFITGTLLNLWGSVIHQWTINLQRTHSFNIYGTVTPIFTILGATDLALPVPEVEVTTFGTLAFVIAIIALAIGVTALTQKKRE